MTLSTALMIRQATVADVNSLVHLINAGGPDGKPRLQLAEQVPQHYFDAFTQISRNEHQKLIVAELDGQVVGTLHLSFIYDLSGANRPDAQVESVHVLQSMRSKGIGKSMMEWAIACAKSKNSRRMQLTSDLRRVDAHRFYERLGFKSSHKGMKLWFD